MAYNHGIGIRENASIVAEPVEGTAGLQVIVGAAPVNLADDPYAATNRPILAESFAEAAAAVGYCEDFANYNLCEAIAASFKVVGVAPIVLINVLDPTIHKTDFTDQEYTIEGGVATIPVFGILADTLSVTADGEELTADEDFVVSFDDDGYAVITLVNADPNDAPGTLVVSGSVIDPTAVTYEDIIGYYDTDTGEETGLEVIREVFPEIQMTPGLILSPGWSKDPNVGAAIVAKSTGINGIFRCENILDLDTSEESGARKYTDVLAVKEASGFTSETSCVEWPCFRVGDLIFHGSAIKGAITAYCDAENDDVPNLSPSNKAISGGLGPCLEDGTEVILDETQANVVNSYGVCTFNRFGEWKTWGNNTAAYPGTKEMKDRWFNIRRFFSWWGNSFIRLYHDKVDDPADPRLVQAVVDAENIRGNSYAAQGKVAGLYTEYREEDNTLEDIMNGKVEFLTHLAPYPPAEYIVNTLEFDPDLLEAAFTGGE